MDEIKHCSTTVQVITDGDQRHATSIRARQNIFVTARKILQNLCVVPRYVRTSTVVLTHLYFRPRDEAYVKSLVACVVWSVAVQQRSNFVSFNFIRESLGGKVEPIRGSAPGQGPRKGWQHAHFIIYNICCNFIYPVFQTGNVLLCSCL